MLKQCETGEHWDSNYKLHNTVPRYIWVSTRLLSAERFPSTVYPSTILSIIWLHQMLLSRVVKRIYADSHWVSEATSKADNWLHFDIRCDVHLFRRLFICRKLHYSDSLVERQHKENAKNIVTVRTTFLLKFASRFLIVLIPPNLHTGWPKKTATFLFLLISRQPLNQIVRNFNWRQNYMFWILYKKFRKIGISSFHEGVPKFDCL